MVDDHVTAGQFDETCDGDGEIVGACIAVPDGIYVLKYICHETKIYFRKPKVVLNFSIVEDETYSGTPIERFYNVVAIKGPPMEGGEFKAPARGNLVREINCLIGKPKRLDRVSFKPLKGKRIHARLETVTRNHLHAPLPKSEQYSRIAELIKVLDDEF